MALRSHRHHLFLYLFYMDCRLHCLPSPWRGISLTLRHYGGHIWRHDTSHYCSQPHQASYRSNIHGLASVSISVGFLISQFSLPSIRVSTLISLRLLATSGLIAHLLLSLSPSVSLLLTKILENHKNITLTLRVPSPSIRTHTPSLYPLFPSLNCFVPRGR